MRLAATALSALMASATRESMSVEVCGEHLQDPQVRGMGKLVEEGPIEQLLESENEFVRQFIKGEPRGPLGMD